MRKLILIALLTISINSYSQEAVDRENKLFELFNNFSTAYLFNTYGLIGSLADGYDHNTYDNATVTDLMNAQKKLASDLATVIEKKLDEELFSDDKRKKYLNSFISVLKEFSVQIDLFLKMVKNNSRKNQDAYVDQRKKSWKDISSLVGIKD